MVSQRGAFPQALLVELGTGALEADVPSGSWIAVEGHGLAIDHALGESHTVRTISSSS